MSVKCKYSDKFKPLLNTLKSKYSGNELKAELEKLFEDAETIFTSLNQETAKEKIQQPGSSPVTVIENNEVKKIENDARRGGKALERVVTGPTKEILDVDDSVPISTLYKNETRYRNMIRSFKKNMIEMAIYNPDGGFISPMKVTNGLSTLNRNLFRYQIDLANSIRAEVEGLGKIEYSEELDAAEFTSLINESLLAFNNLSPIKQEVLFDKYVQLKKFDQLLIENISFIDINDSYKGKTLRGKDKYKFVIGGAHHYSGYTSDESADVFLQTSDLFKILLDYFPELSSVQDNDGNYVAIPNSSINERGFTSAMAAFRSFCLSPPRDGNITIRDSHGGYTQEWRTYSTIKEKYLKGAEMPISSLLDLYLEWLDSNAATAKNDVVDRRMSFLSNKIRAIKHYIYDSDLDPEIKNIFTHHFEKTVKISYRSYNYNNEARNITGQEKTDILVDVQRYRLLDQAKALISIYISNPDYLNRIKEKYNIHKDDDGVYWYGSTAEQSNDKYMTDVVNDLLNLNIPEDFFEVTEAIYGKFANDESAVYKVFAPLMNVVLNKVDEKSKDLSKQAFLFNNVAKIYSVLYGSDTVSVIKNDEGNNLPVYQLMSMVYNVQKMMYNIDQYPNEIQTNKGIFKRKNIYANNMFVKNPDFIEQAQVRSEITINGITKQAKQLTVNELLRTAFLKDFYNEYQKGVIYLQNTTFADKNTHFLIPYNIGQDIDLAGNPSINLKSIIDNAIRKGNSIEIIKLIQAQRNEMISRLRSNIINDYNVVYSANFQSFDQVNEFIKSKSLREIQTDFEIAGVDFHKEIHAYSPKGKFAKDANGKTIQSKINETIYNWNKTFSTLEGTLKRFENERRTFANHILSQGLNISAFDGADARRLFDNHPDWANQNNGQVELVKLQKLDSKGRVIETINHLSMNDLALLDNKSYKVILHPALEAWFATDALLSNEFNSLLLGEIFAHPNKNGAGETEEEYFEFSEANRLIAENKRAVICGATTHIPLQGLRYGVPRTISTAVMNDVKLDIFNFIGDTAKLDTADGSGLSHPLMTIWENNSYTDARVGQDRKTIWGDVDPHYGKADLLKWAVYNISNERRRKSRGSINPLESVYEKMSNISFDKFIDFAKYYQPDITNEYLYFYNRENNKNYRIDAINTDLNGQVIVKIREVDEFGIAKDTYREIIYNKPTTVYELDQILGGAWVKSLVDGRLEYSEANMDILSKIVCDEGLKDKIVHFAVNGSAIKVGATNMNDSSKYSGFNANVLQIQEGQIVDPKRYVNLDSIIDLIRTKAIFAKRTGTPINLPVELTPFVSDIKPIIDSTGIDIFNEALTSFEKDFVSGKHNGKQYVYNKLPVEIIDTIISKFKNRHNHLTTFTMSTEFGGVQMNADHLVDLAEVTEMTQMISSFVQNGNSSELVNNLYADIGKIVDESLLNFTQAIDARQKDPNSEDLYRLLGKALVDSFKGNDKETLGLAQAFVNKASKNLKDAKINYHIPFSANTLSGKFFAQISALLNKRGIRRKYDGFAGVLVPSYNMIQYYMYGNESMPYEKMLLKMQKLREAFYAAHPEITESITIDQFMKEPMFYVNGSFYKNPNLSLTTSDQFEQEDTIVLVSKIGTPDGQIIEQVAETIYLNNYLAYDQLKNRDLSEYDIYKLTSAPRNLKGLNTFMTVDGVRRSIYDSDVSRTLLYLGLKSRTPEQQNLVNLAIQQLGIKESDLKPALVKLQNDLLSGRSNVFYFGQNNIIENITVQPAEIIMGKSNAQAFGLRKNDSISDINEAYKQGVNWFKERLMERYELPEGIDHLIYDAILYTGDNKKVFVKIGDKSVLDNITLDANDTGFKTLEDDVYYDGKRIGSTDEKQFYSFLDQNGESQDLIVVDNIDRFNEIRKSFETYRLHYTHRNYKTLMKFEHGSTIAKNSKNGKETIFEINRPWVDSTGRIHDYRRVNARDIEPSTLQILSNQNFEKRLDKLGYQKYQSFLKSLDFIAARIPTQGMQSYMPMRVVMFTDSEYNDVHVPPQQTWLQGSDYDKTHCCSKISLIARKTIVN